MTAIYINMEIIITSEHSYARTRRIVLSALDRER